VEVGMGQVMRMGESKTVKVLGSLCLLDQGELDWKIIGINLEEAKKHNIKNIEDYNRVNPGALKSIHDWFRTYKTFEGKGENTFGYKGEFLTAERTLEIIHENHSFYQDLVSGKAENKEKLWLGP
jgi:inorganic pyrophosphatase